SHVYRNTPGFYDTLRPANQIPGWAYNAARDTEYDPATPPAWGKPTCKQWWEGGAIGLRKKLIDEADATSAGFSGLVVAVAPALAGEQQNDAVARTVLTNSPPSWSNNDLVANNSGSTGLLSTAENIVKGGLAAGGVLTASALFSVTITAVLQALPMVQAMLLLGIYALLPMVVVLSRYSLSMMVVGAMAIFTVKFWSVLWYLAMWVDQNLIQSMYPDVNIFLQIFANPGEHDTKRMLLNMITTSLYLGLPLVWSGMMAWVGVQVGRSLETATISLRSPARDAGAQGGNIGKTAVTKGVKH
ncbi:MAG: conjugal transfer protein TraG, partial [Gammaproteobacteria bacterium]|nr:conjugal transfer protein TraG [Gammaproteobacteria bacterium]